jgi:hypothetical protein
MGLVFSDPKMAPKKPKQIQQVIVWKIDEPDSLG